MDPVSDVARRNLLAKHLREVVDILEQKVNHVFLLRMRRCDYRSCQGDQIAALYDLLTFKDKPVEESVVPPRRSTEISAKTRSGRMVSATAVPSTGRSAGAGIRRQHTALA